MGSYGYRQRHNQHIVQIVKLVDLNRAAEHFKKILASFVADFFYVLVSRFF